MKSLIKKRRNYKTKKNKKNKKTKYVMNGGNKIEFKFIDLNDYTDEEKDSQIKEIDVLVQNTNTKNNDSQLFKKNVLRFMKN